MLYYFIMYTLAHYHIPIPQIKGLPEALKDPHSMVSTNYSSLYAPKTFENVKRFRGGHALFTFPPMPIKCPGAPQKIMYLAEDYWRKVSLVYNPDTIDTGVRSSVVSMHTINVKCALENMRN